jgi:hypothetical protein
MADEKKFKVTLHGTGFNYTVVLEANEKTTMKELADKAIVKIKEQYGVDVPREDEYEIEFEIVE